MWRTMLTRELSQAALATALAAGLAGGCSTSERPSQSQPVKQILPTRSSPAATAPCEKESMSGDVLKLRESTSNPLSNKDVGISNIIERELPDDQGTVASRVSCVLVIHDPKTDEIQRETVFAGQTVSIGSDRYCVVSVEPGKGAPGWVSLRALK